MSDALILAASVKTALLEIARQANALGNGLQNAAPGNKDMANSNNSVTYLIAIAENIIKIADSCGKINSN